MLRDEIIRQMSLDDFQVYTRLMKLGERELAIIFALVFNGRYKSKDFVRRFRNILEVEASENLQEALESSAY